MMLRIFWEDLFNILQISSEKPLDSSYFMKKIFNKKNGNLAFNFQPTEFGL